MARVRAASNDTIEPLSEGWQLSEARLGSGPVPTSPSEVWPAPRAWSSALCPGTVASALRAQGEWDWSSTRHFDGSDWWYRTRFASAPCAPGESLSLELGGLATIADVWLNGTHVLRSENMFCAHALDVSPLIAAENELLVRFSALDVALGARRPRPRFKTRLIEKQQLRWFRTTLLGRIPGWTPPVTAVGPWRGAQLVRRRDFVVQRVSLRSRIEGGRALVRASLELELLGATVERAALHVGEHSIPLQATLAGHLFLDAELELPDAERWWPHGYGSQRRYPARIVLGTSDGRSHELDFDPLAFRSLRLDTANGRFALVVNDHEIRCRGACWTPTDVVSLNDEVSTLATVQQAHAAGMNMLRVGGTMVYECDAFYEACDALGILVWQDFMFANCDYPAEDAEFGASVTREAEQFLSRCETRACLAVLCGNSEIEQQMAMLGLPRDSWQSPLFEQLLRGIAGAQRPDVPYITSTPTGGALPFQANTGLTHYYGVGAYLRPLDDARRAEVKFTSECLAFANIPEESTVAQVLGDGPAPFHHPRWKVRSPRDNGAGWDFDDVRDHYTKLLFGVEPSAVRYEDPERALALGRVTSGEVMARTLGEWRRAASPCRGALLWFLRDLWPGAGWGVIDSRGLPKAAYYFVKRAMQARALFLSDEGLNGLSLHVVNDSEAPLVAELELQLIRNGAVRVATGSARLELPGRSALEQSCATLFEHFIDLTHAYRFGPRQYDVAVAQLRDAESGAQISQVSYFPGGFSAERSEDLGLEATLRAVSDREWRLRLSCTRFAQAIAIDLPGFTPEDAYFDLLPGLPRELSVVAQQPGSAPRGFVHALNAQGPTRINVSKPT